MFAIIAWLVWSIVVPAAIAYGISYFLATKPEKLKPPVGKYHYDLPTAEEGRPLPVIGGKVRLRGLNAISPIFNKRRIFMESRTYGAATLYMVGLHLGVGIGKIHIKQLWFGETVVWPADKQPSIEAADGVTHAEVDAEECWGSWGYGQGGGVGGQLCGADDVFILHGGATQSLNYVLEDKYGSDQPNYRGFTSMVLKELYIGTAPMIRPISAFVKRTDDMCDYSEMWYLEKANIGDNDLNAIHWIYELLTSKIIGRGIDPSLIGDSFTEAADTCYTEGYGISFIWDFSPDDIASQIEQIEKIIDGKLYFSMVTEKYEFALNRPDYEPAELEIFDESDFWIEDASYLLPGFVPNKVVVIWEHRIWNQKRVAYDDDIALLARQNGLSCIIEYDYSGYIKSASLAEKIAARNQYAFSAMPKRFTLRCLRTMSHLHECSVFKISYPDLNIASMIVRLISIDRGSLSNDECIIECIEDVFGQAYTVYGEPPESEVEEEEGTQEREYYDLESTVWDRLSNQIVYDKLSGDMVTWRHD